MVVCLESCVLSLFPFFVYFTSGKRFVTWVFINAGFSESYIGHGVGNQAAKGVRITWDEAEPGDLAVYSDNSHIGIVAGRKDNGSLLVIHCNAGANNVVITDEEGFAWAVKVLG